MNITVNVDTALLREQRDWLLSLPSNAPIDAMYNAEGLLNMLDAMLDLAEVGAIQ